MANKFVLLLVGVILLAQNSWAAPAPNEASEEVEDNSFKAVIERFKLLEITSDELTELHKIVIEKGTPVFKKVLEDPKILEVKNDAMEENIKKLQKFLDQIEKDPKETESKIFEILDEFGEIVNKFSKEKNENLSEDEEIVQKSLDEHGLSDLKTAILEDFKEFFEKFTKEVDSYIKGLTEKAKKEEENLITWVEKLKAEKDIEKQFDMLDTFFSGTTDTSSSESSE